MTIRVGTRASALAVAQTRQVADRMAAASGVPVELVLIESDGDRLTGSLASLGGTGVFASALRDALLAGECDAIVHSLKDLPVAPVPGLVIGAVPEREDPRDALCARDGHTLATLPRGASVGTGSPRRRAALLATRPDLVVVDIRGNIDTRLKRKTADLDAVVLAVAGLTRLGRLDEATEILDFDVMPQAPGQGALAVEVRDPAAGDSALTAESETPTGVSLSAELVTALAAIEHAPTRARVIAERSLLGALEAGCAAPVGASGTVTGDRLDLDAVVLGDDGVRSIRRSTTGSLDDAEAAGRRLAADLISAGAADLAPLGARS